MPGTQHPATTTEVVDPRATITGFAMVATHDGNPLKAVQAAYNSAAARAAGANRKPVMISVIVHVAPEA